MGKLVDIDEVKKAIDKAIKERWAGREYVGLPVHDEYIVEGLEEAKKAVVELVESKSEKPNIVEDLKRYLKNTTREQQEADWKRLEKWAHVGPTVEEYLHAAKNFRLPEEMWAVLRKMVEEQVANVQKHRGASGNWNVCSNVYYGVLRLMDAIAQGREGSMKPFNGTWRTEAEISEIMDVKDQLT